MFLLNMTVAELNAPMAYTKSADDVALFVFVRTCTRGYCGDVLQVHGGAWPCVQPVRL